MSYQETREIVRSRNAQVLQELLTAIDRFNDEYDKDPNTVDLFIDGIEEGRSIDAHFVLKSINRQRAANKIIDELAWHFSYHTLYMAIANLARLDSIKNINPETKQIWWQRYLDMVDHNNLRESRDRWHQRYLRAKAAIQRRMTPKRWMVL